MVLRLELPSWGIWAVATIWLNVYCIQMASGLSRKKNTNGIVETDINRNWTSNWWRWSSWVEHHHLNQHQHSPFALLLPRSHFGPWTILRGTTGRIALARDADADAGKSQKARNMSDAGHVSASVLTVHCWGLSNQRTVLRDFPVRACRSLHTA